MENNKNNTNFWNYEKRFCEFCHAKGRGKLISDLLGEYPKTEKSRQKIQMKDKKRCSQQNILVKREVDNKNLFEWSQYYPPIIISLCVCFSRWWQVVDHPIWKAYNRHSNYYRLSLPDHDYQKICDKGWEDPAYYVNSWQIEPWPHTNSFICDSLKCKKKNFFLNHQWHTPDYKEKSLPQQ